MCSWDVLVWWTPFSFHLNWQIASVEISNQVICKTKQTNKNPTNKQRKKQTDETLLWLVGLFKFILNWCHMISIWRREPYLGKRNIEEKSLCLDAYYYNYILTFFQITMIKDTTKVYGWIKVKWIWPSFTGLQEHYNFCSYSIVNCHAVAKVFTFVDHVTVREMTAK